MFDTKRSYFNDNRERPMPVSVSVVEEGQAMAFAPDDGSGVSKVRPSTGVALEVPAGFAITDALKRTTETVFEVVTVPAAPGPYTVSLKFSNVSGTSPTAEVNVYEPATLTTFAQVAAAPAAAQFAVNTLTGVVTFNAADAEKVVNVTYRYNMTALQISQKYQQRSVNNTAQDIFSSMSLGCGFGEIFTDQFDVTLTYVLNASLYLGATGRLTSSAVGTKVGMCSKLPSSGGDGLLGCKFDLDV